MTLHVLHAGDGYSYLTRQVASGDQERESGTALTDYYLASGEPPGRWVGSGLAGLEMRGMPGTVVSGVVREDQMRALFGEGLHPEADMIIAAQLAQKATPQQAIKAAALGRRFPTFTNDSPLKVAYNEALNTFRTEHGRGADDAERRQLRRDLARDLLRGDRPNAEPSDRQVSAYIAAEQRSERQPVAGIDLVFTPVKSIVALWAVGDHETRQAIEAAHEAAWRQVLGWIEKEASFTRKGAAGIAQIDTRGLVATAFDHRTSRTGDPDLHTHVAVANRVQGPDGRWRAIDARVLHSAAVSASEMYNARIENEVRDRLGVAFVDVERADGKRAVREVAGVPTALTRAFSQRRQEIEVRYTELVRAYRQEHGRDPAPATRIDLAQRATLDTREGKQPAKSLGQLVDEARETARSLGITDPETTVLAAARAATSPTAELTSDEVISARVLSVVSETRSTWNRWNVRAEIERQLRAEPTIDRDRRVDHIEQLILGDQESLRITPDEANPPPAELCRANGESQLRVHGQERYTSTAVLAAEGRLLAAAATPTPVGVDVTPAGFGAAVVDYHGAELDPGQRNLVTHFVGSGTVLAVGVGPAGAGKTRAMAAMARVWESTGGRVIGVAPSAVAARVLSEDLATPAETLTMLLTRDRHGRLSADAVRAGDMLLVDEASMASTQQLDRLLAIATERGAVIRLIGDPEQLGAVDAGGTLDLIVREVGGAELTELHRFRDPLEAEATLAVRAGDQAAIEFYAGRGRIHEHAHDGALDAAYAGWRADRALGRTALLIAKTNDDAAALNARARTELVAAGQVEAAGTTLRDGVIAGVGDQIVTRSVDRSIGVGARGDFVRNGDLWTITAIAADGSLSVQRIGTSLTAVLPPAYAAAHVDLGYASTAHRSQGMTVDRAHVLVDASMSRQDLYVPASRGREENHLYVVAEHTDIDLHTQPEGRRTADDVLAAVLATDGNERSATTTTATETDQANSLARLVPEYLHGVDLLSPPLDVAAALLPVFGTERTEELITDPALPALITELRHHRRGGIEPTGAIAEAAAPGFDPGSPVVEALKERLAETRPQSSGGPLPWTPATPGPGRPSKQALADWTSRHGELISARARELATTAATERPDWYRQLPPATPPALVEAVAAYRDQYRITDPEPLGHHEPAPGDQTRIAASLTRQLAELPPGNPADEIDAADLHRRVDELRADLAEVETQAARQQRLAEHLATSPTVAEVQRRHNDIEQRAAMVEQYRQALATATALRPVLGDRAAQIAAAEQRAADGGRRAARREADNLERLRQEQQADAAVVDAAAAQVRQLGPAIGNDTEQDAVLSARQQIRQQGHTQLQAAAERDQQQAAQQAEQAAELRLRAEQLRADLAFMTAQLEVKASPAQEVEVPLARTVHDLYGPADPATELPTPDLDEPEFDR